MSAAAPATHAPRPPATALAAGWADKSTETLVRKPFYRRKRFLQFALTGLLVLVTAGVVGGLFLYRWHREQQDDLARQRRGVEAFVRSAAFERFARKADAQFVAALNFTAVRSEVAGGLLPEIAAAEQARHQMPWALELPPLPVSIAAQPARVHLALRDATDLLARRGLAFDAARLADARRVFLRVLAPDARAFVAENARADFPALFLDRRMQDIALSAYAARAGGTVADCEHAFAFYSLVGPAMWREIHSQHRQPGPRKQSPLSTAPPSQGLQNLPGRS